MLTSRSTAIAVMSVLLCVAFGATPMAQAKHFNILMIGNSYTQGNATARATSLDLQGLFDADPDFSANVTQRADSSASLQQHVSNPATTSMITNPANHWDVIVLQERSERPALAIKNGGSERTGLDAGGPVLIGNYIVPYQPQASVVLFDTWARKLGNQDLIDDFDNDPAEMQTYTNQGYERIRKNGSKWDYSSFTTIAHVGDAWADWYSTYGYSANVLHDVDGTHQNNRGAYLAAAVLFETITGKTTVGNNYAGAVTGTIGDVNQVLLLQQQAMAVTNSVAGMPGDYNEDGVVDSADYSCWRDALGGSSALSNDNSPGVGQDDLARWKTHFGDTSDSRVLVANSVPEMGTIIYGLMALAAAIGRACVVARSARGIC